MFVYIVSDGGKPFIVFKFVGVAFYLLRDGKGRVQGIDEVIQKAHDFSVIKGGFIPVETKTGIQRILQMDQCLILLRSQILAGGTGQFKGIAAGFCCALL